MKRLKESEYIGQRYTGSNNLAFTIIKYHRTDNVVVEFDLSKNKKVTQMAHIRRGTVKDTKYLEELKPKKRTIKEYSEEKIQETSKKYLNKTFTNSNNEKFEVIEYKGKYKVKIKFLETGSIKTVSSSHIIDGSVIDENTRWQNNENLLKGYHINQKGYLFHGIILSENKREIFIQFKETGYMRWASVDAVKAGKVKDNMSRDACGVGYLGEPKQDIKYYNKALNLWHGMIRRCYDESFRENAQYKKATVSERWKSFQFFLEDIPKLGRFDRWLKEPMHLDKDLKGNSQYYDVSTCIFLTPEENRKEQELRYKGLKLELTN